MGQCSFQLMIGAAFIEETTVKTALKGTVHLHHFWFSKLHLGKVFVKVANNSNEPVESRVLETILSEFTFTSDSLSQERQQYDKI